MWSLGDPCGGTRQVRLDRREADLEIHENVTASRPYIVAVKYTATTDAKGADGGGKDFLRPKLRKRCKIPDEKNQAYFLLEPEKIIGYPGGGFMVNKGGADLTQHLRKIPAPQCAAASFELGRKGSAWSFDWKLKKWVRGGSDSSDSSDSSSDSSSTSSESED